MWVVAGVCSSCGILGRSSYESPYILDNEVAAQLVTFIDNKPIARKIDSLLAKIDSAGSTLPADLGETALLVETYSCDEFNRVWENKFTPAPENDKFGYWKMSLRRCKQYERSKNRLVRKPRYSLIYAGQSQHHQIDFRTAKYVLKTTNRVAYDPDQLRVTKDTTVLTITSTAVYYLVDRERNAIVAEVPGLSVLKKRK